MWATKTLLCSVGQNLFPGFLTKTTGVSRGALSSVSYSPAPPCQNSLTIPQMGFFVLLLQGGLPGPGLSGASPTLALTPQCGLDVATVPYKPQCAAGAGAGLGWVERKTAQDGAMKTPHQP